MISFTAFSDELVKIAGAGAIPVVSRLPQDADRALETIKRNIDKSQKAIIGHPNVAVPVKHLGNLADRGFKRTRLAVPLPGERIGTPSWRRGELHAHRRGEHYLMHKDQIPPQEGAVKAVRHWMHEGLPAAKKRFKERMAPAIGGR